MEIRKSFSLLILFVVSSALFAQNLKITGTAKPGYALIGQAQGIKQVFLDDKEIPFDGSDIFVFGFNRDETGTHILKVDYINGTSETKEYTLPKREYKTQHINSKKKQFSTPPQDELARIEREKQVMVEARAKMELTDTTYFKTGFFRPVKGGRITGVYGSQRIVNGEPQNIHYGLDFAKPEGSPVYAMADGIVQLARENFYYNGTFVLIDHGQSLSSIYIHLSKLDIKEGDFVKKGQKIGEVGTTGRSTGAHLHWEVKWNKKHIDPACILELKF